MAARNCLVALSKIKAVGFEFGTLLASESVSQNPANPCEDSLAVLTALQKRGIKTGVLNVPQSSKNRTIMQPEFSGLSPEQCMFVGRFSDDIKSANEAGMFTVLLDRSETAADFGQQFSILYLDELLHYL
jgi:hypothetical protein